MKRRIICLLITVTMMLALCPFGMPSVTAETATEGYYTYEVIDGEAIITKASTEISGDVIIPSTLGGYPVI